MSKRKKLTSRERHKFLRGKLFVQQSGLCFWCHRPMRLSGYEPRRGVRPPLDLVTLDHLDDRYSKERGSFPGRLRKVVACWECNTQRGKDSQAAQPIEELRRRSKRHPQNEPELPV